MEASERILEDIITRMRHIVTQFNIANEYNTLHEELVYILENIELLNESYELNNKTIKENKKFKEARAMIEKVFYEKYVKYASDYENGYLDGLETAMNAIDDIMEE